MKTESDFEWEAYESFWSNSVANKQAHPRATWEAAWKAAKEYFTSNAQVKSSTESEPLIREVKNEN